jgi:hypothetical protein
MLAVEQRTDAHEHRGLSATHIVSASAILLGIVGLALLAFTALTTDPAVGLETEARSGGMSLWVSNVEWLDHAHDDAGGAQTAPAAGDEGATDVASTLLTGQGNQGFQMPANMMPGTPDQGFQRVQIDLDFTNREDGRQVSPADFTLVAEGRRAFQPNIGGSFVPTIIGPSQQFSTMLSFDIPQSISPDAVELRWSDVESDDNIRFAISGGHGSHG